MRVLTFNAGSSSLRFALHETTGDPLASPAEEAMLTGSVERIGKTGGNLRLSLAGQSAKEQPITADSPAHAAKQALDEVLALTKGNPLDAIGCRVVHGGDRFHAPARVDAAVLQAIHALGELAPLHNPAAVDLIQMVQETLPECPVVAVFDTAFHHTLPEVAFRYALPRDLSDRHKLRRYGFHGIAHRYVSTRLLDRLACGVKGTRVVTCHLGNGASVCAVRDGRSIDTSMGLTPLEGLVMGTRAGDVDPGLVLHLLGAMKMSVDEVDDLLNHQSGLGGLAGDGKSDARDLESAAAKEDVHAKLALEIFAYRAAKYIGSYAVALEGLDAIAFSGGIGEHSAKMRARICRRLGFLGLRLDDASNQAADGSTEAPIHVKDGNLQAWVIPADENRQMAREMCAFLKAK